MEPIICNVCGKFEHVNDGFFKIVKLTKTRCSNKKCSGFFELYVKKG